MYDLRIIHGSCYIEGHFVDQNIYITNGKIALISSDLLEAKKTVDAMHYKVLPGFIDPHVHLHLNIGKTFSADDFTSGSYLAAFGGVTTIIDFLDPINHLHDFDEVYQRRLKEASTSIVDYSFHATLGNFKGQVVALVDKVKDAGLGSIKVFTTYSDSDRRCSYDVIKEILNEDILLLSHAEDDDMIKACMIMENYEASRSEASELSAVKKLISLMSDDSRLYIVHVSSGHTLETISKRQGLYLETCPHYLYLDKGKFLKDDGKLFLLAPPIRGKDSIKLIKEHISMIDSIGTDHCPFMKEEKLVNDIVDHIPKGIGGLGLSFQLMYDMFGDAIIDKFTVNPAEIFGLSDKGKIEVGKDADFAIIDPKGLTDCSLNLTKANHHSFSGVLNTEVKVTISRGHIIMSNGEVHPNKGQFIRRV